MAVRGLCSLDDVATGEASHLFGFARAFPDDTPTTRDLAATAAALEEAHNRGEGHHDPPAAVAPA